MERHRIFISYGQSDSAGHAGRLDDDLTRLLRRRVFMLTQHTHEPLERDHRHVHDEHHQGMTRGALLRPALP